jgi:hypothetical protein
MNRKDINSINDVFRMVMEKAGPAYFNTLMESTANTSNTGGDASALYSYGPEKLRVNHFTKQGAINSTATYDDGSAEDFKSLLGSNNIVMFTTMKISENENDVLHNAFGPAVIFENGGEGNEFWFDEGKPVKPEDMINKQNNIAASNDPRVTDTFGDADMLYKTNKF